MCAAVVNMRFFDFHLLLIFINFIHFSKCSNDNIDCYQSESENINERLIQRANHYRKLHSVAPVTSDSRLISNAIKWSRRLAESNKIECSPRLDEYGETILCYNGHGAHDDSRIDVVKKWYIHMSENKIEKSYSNELISDRTKKMGCGICTNFDQEITIITCRFLSSIQNGVFNNLMVQDSATQSFRYSHTTKRRPRIVYVKDEPTSSSSEKTPMTPTTESTSATASKETTRESGDAIPAAETKSTRSSTSTIPSVAAPGDISSMNIESSISLTTNQRRTLSERGIVEGSDTDTTDVPLPTKEDEISLKILTCSVAKSRTSGMSVIPIVLEIQLIVEILAIFSLISILLCFHFRRKKCSKLPTTEPSEFRYLISFRKHLYESKQRHQ